MSEETYGAESLGLHHSLVRISELTDENEYLRKKTLELSLHPCCCEENKRLREALEKIARTIVCEGLAVCPRCISKEALSHSDSGEAK